MRNADAPFLVYKATNIINGKIYIGVTVQGLLRRSKAHISEALAKKETCKKFHRAIRKYGVVNFTWEVIALAQSKLDMKNMEIDFISKLRPDYNCTNGGDGVNGTIRTAKWNANISKGLKGRPGIKLTPEIIAKANATRRSKNPGRIDGTLSQERLKELFHYDPLTGVFTRLISVNQFINKRPYEEKTNGYIRFTIDGKRYMAHQLAWLYVHGEWTKIGHKDRIRSNNRIDNLRVQTQSLTSAGKKVSRSNHLGVKGVRLHECGKFLARISAKGQNYYLGLFDTLDKASEAYTQKAKELFGEYARV